MSLVKSQAGKGWGAPVVVDGTVGGSVMAAPSGSVGHSSRDLDISTAMLKSSTAIKPIPVFFLRAVIRI